MEGYLISMAMIHLNDDRISKSLSTNPNGCIFFFTVSQCCGHNSIPFCPELVRQFDDPVACAYVNSNYSILHKYYYANRNNSSLLNTQSHPSDYRHMGR